MDYLRTVCASAPAFRCSRLAWLVRLAKFIVSCAFADSMHAAQLMMSFIALGNPDILHLVHHSLSVKSSQAFHSFVGIVVICEVGPNRHLVKCCIC